MCTTQYTYIIFSSEVYITEFDDQVYIVLVSFGLRGLCVPMNHFSFHCMTGLFSPTELFMGLLPQVTMAVLRLRKFHIPTYNNILTLKEEWRVKFRHFLLKNLA